jgi:DNA-binding response OmpR family regulator
MRLLVVEDEIKIKRIVTQALRGEGFVVDEASDAQTAMDMVDTWPYQLIVLDIILPKQKNGTAALTHLRQHAHIRENRTIPVLMLTALDATADKISHFSQGADDYLTKPFAIAELVARVHVLLRRQMRPFHLAQAQNVLEISDLVLDRVGRTVKRGHRLVELSSKEFTLLDYLASHSGQVLSRSMILENVWNQGFEGLTNIVDVYIRQLRIKIDDNEPVKLIHTVRGVGYCLRGQP